MENTPAPKTAAQKVPVQKTKEQTLAWLRTISGELATATLKRLEDTLPWYGDMPPGRRSAVGLVAQAGITSFISWFEDPKSTPWIAADVFGAAPRELLRSVSLTQKLSGSDGPFVAVTDYMHAVPDQIRQFVPGDYVTLGADDFGFSDTRAAARRFFKIDGPSMVVKTLEALAKRGLVDRSVPAQAIEKYRLLDVNAGTTGSVGGES